MASSSGQFPPLSRTPQFLGVPAVPAGVKCDCRFHGLVNREGLGSLPAVSLEERLSQSLPDSSLLAATFFKSLLLTSPEHTQKQRKQGPGLHQLSVSNSEDPSFDGII